MAKDRHSTITFPYISVDIFPFYYIDIYCETFFIIGGLFPLYSNGKIYRTI